MVARLDVVCVFDIEGLEIQLTASKGNISVINFALHGAVDSMQYVSINCFRGYKKMNMDCSNI